MEIVNYSSLETFIKTSKNHDIHKDKWLLIFAIKDNNLEIVKYLVNKGVDISTWTFEEVENPDIARYLINQQLKKKLLLLDNL